MNKLKPSQIKALSDEELLATLKEVKQKKSSLKEDLKKQGDIHLQNIYRFFKKWVDKSHPLRTAIKNIVFGVIYGKGAKTLANDIWQEAVTSKENALFEYRKSLTNPTKEEKAKLREMEEDVENTRDSFDDYLKQAKDIMAKMADEWHDLYVWMDKMHEDCIEKGYVEAPHGRRRHLLASFLSDRSLKAALMRRAVNAPVQGFGSDVGYMSARLIEIHMVKFLREFDLFNPNDPVIPCGVECAVHDALYQTVPYHLLLPALHIMQWCMTTGVTNLYAEKFNNKWLVPPEIETGISWSGDKEESWDYTHDSLYNAVKSAIEHQYECGYGHPDYTVEQAIKACFNIPKEQRAYLKKHYQFFDDPVHLRT